MAEDGLIYDRAAPERPWNVGVYYGKKDWNEDYANMAGNGRLLAGLTHWSQMTGEDQWKERARQTAQRMLELAIVDGDRAYYPNPGLGNDFSYPRKSGWTTTDPPIKHNEGFEGATLFYQCQPLRGFTRYARLTGDERFVELSRKFANFALQPQFWGGEQQMSFETGAQRGHFRGHFHGMLAALRSLLDYALLADDWRLKLLIRDSYEWARQLGIHRLGLFPHSGEWVEGCTLGDMVGLSVALTDAGLGDYWDDVEMFVRNGLVSAQATDSAELKRVSAAGKHRLPSAEWGGALDTRFRSNNRGVLPGQEIHDRVLERTVGQFGHIWGARYQIPQMMACCTANCSQALYYAWEAIVRRSGDTATINLWLNRRSPWVDVWSWLPHEGKLVVQNKGMRTIMVRKPGWAAPGKVRCLVDDQLVTPSWLGNRLVLRDLKGLEQIVLEVPVPQDTAEYTMVNLNDPSGSQERYECEFRGYTALATRRTAAGAEKEEGDWYRLYRRESLRAAQPPTKEMASYVHPEKLVRWLEV